ncbi:MAG: tetratricopeptide repeat protein [Treponematales bacterium]
MMDKNVAIGLLTCGIALIGIPTVGWVTVFVADKMESLKQQYPLVIIIAWLMTIGGAVLVFIGGAGLMGLTNWQMAIGGAVLVFIGGAGLTGLTEWKRGRNTQNLLDAGDNNIRGMTMKRIIVKVIISLIVAVMVGGGILVIGHLHATLTEPASTEITPVGKDGNGLTKEPQVETAPRSVSEAYDEGQKKFRSGEWLEAIMYYTQAIELYVRTEPKTTSDTTTYIQTYVDRGTAYARKIPADYKKSVSDYQFVMENFPSHKDKVKNDTHYDYVEELWEYSPQFEDDIANSLVAGVVSEKAGEVFLRGRPDFDDDDKKPLHPNEHLVSRRN